MSVHLHKIINMKNENLVTVIQFAELIGKGRQDVYRLITPAQIKPDIIAGKYFIDIKKYPPKKFSAKK